MVGAFGYFADALVNIVNGNPNSPIDDLLPWAYIAAPRAQGRGLTTSLTN